ncbi:MAG TPA: dockerin type I domain-containing protein [Pseudobacteroides sp.]|uniref:dockerin type I domain-containing protein n=1 Tax=Pseudobacteroides sp. TaxID=1968840 RepID=UPI002F937735
MYLNNAFRQTAFILLFLTTIMLMPVYSAAEAEPAKVPTKIVWNNPTTELLKPNMLGGNYSISVTLTDANNNPLQCKNISWTSTSVGVSNTTVTDTQGVSINPVTVFHQDKNITYSADITIQFAGDELYEPTTSAITLRCYDTGPPMYYNVIGQVSVVKNSSEDTILNSGFDVKIIDTPYYSKTDDTGVFNFRVDLNQPSIRYSESKLEISKPGYLSREVMLHNFLTSSTENTKDPIKMIAGDINQDDAINMTDIVEMAKTFKAVEGDEIYNGVCDLNNDRVINIADVVIIASNFNKTPLDYEGLDPYFIKL